MTFKDPIYFWDPEQGKSRCEIEFNGLTFVGEAQCHDADSDMCSEKVGMYISELRAKIKFMQYQKRIDQAKLDELTQLYFSINQSKKFSPEGYEAKMLKKRIKMAKTNVENDNKLLEEYRIELRRYIETKDIFYKYIRRNREKDKNK